MSSEAPTPRTDSEERIYADKKALEVIDGQRIQIRQLERELAIARNDVAQLQQSYRNLQREAAQSARGALIEECAQRLLKSADTWRSLDAKLFPLAVIRAEECEAQAANIRALDGSSKDD